MRTGVVLDYTLGTEHIRRAIGVDFLPKIGEQVKIDDDLFVVVNVRHYLDDVFDKSFHLAQADIFLQKI